MCRARILDYTALVNLKDSLKRFSKSFEEPLNAIESELHDILQMMKEKLEVLYKFHVIVMAFLLCLHHLKVKFTFTKNMY